MKRFYFTTIFIITLILLSWINVLGQTKQNSDKWREVEKIYIEYEMIGFQKGKQLVYILGWGKEELTILDVVVEMGPMKQRTHTATYLKGDKIYNVDLKTNKGTVTENTMRSKMSGNQAQQFGEDFMKQQGKEVKPEKILGKTCRVFEMPNMGSKAWIWKNITLKSVTGFGDTKQIMKAVKILFDFDKKILDLPKKVSFKKGQSFDDIMNKMKGKFNN